MAISRGTAAAIVELVEKDSACRERIASVFGILPASWGVAGGARNVAMMAANAPEVTMFVLAPYRRTQMILSDGRINPLNWLPTAGQDPYICVGIAEATRDAINKALTRAGAASSLGQVKSASLEARSTTVTHAATGITMQDGSQYIFDWHCTLRLGDPMLFPSIKDWDATEKGELFSVFAGWA